MAGQDEMPMVWHDWPADRITDNQAPQGPLGFPFHENLETLALSAELCPLCGVVQKGVQAWIENWEDAAKNNKGFIEFSMDTDCMPTKEKLWTTKCYGGAQGFYVWAEHPKRNSMYLLTAVGFSVDNGMNLPYPTVLCISELKLTLPREPSFRSVPSAATGAELRFSTIFGHCGYLDERVF